MATANNARAAEFETETDAWPLVPSACGDGVANPFGRRTWLVVVDWSDGSKPENRDGM